MSQQLLQAEFRPPLSYRVMDTAESLYGASHRWPRLLGAPLRGLMQATVFAVTRRLELRRVVRFKGGTEVWRGRNIGTTDVTIFHCNPAHVTPNGLPVWRVQVVDSADVGNGKDVVRYLEGRTLRAALWQEWVTNWD